MIVALALRSGIPPSVWLAEDARAIETALDLIDQDDGGARPSKTRGVQMSG